MSLLTIHYQYISRTNHTVLTEGVVGEEGAPAEDEIAYEDIALEDIVLKDLPSTPEPWQELGSEADLEEEILTTSRSLITFMIQRKRKLFGTPCQFEDRYGDVIQYFIIVVHQVG